MQASIITCLSQATINWEGCGRRAFAVKVGAVHRQSGWDGIQTDFRCICLCCLSLHHKIQKMVNSDGESW